VGEAGSGEEHAPSHEPEKLATASTAESPVAADAVLVVDTQQAHVEAADLGEVLARVQGINVRREGGLGTATQLSLDGAPLDRVLVDGVPLEAAGFSMEAPNVTPNLFQRADIYRGVVPIRLGVPALNGVMNLVSRYSDAPGLRASYQLGSFGTHRATLEGRYRHEPSGVIASGVGFVDVTRNDYRTLQGLADAAGRVTKENVATFTTRMRRTACGCAQVWSIARGPIGCRWRALYRATRKNCSTTC
jgi:hypothetical protein